MHYRVILACISFAINSFAFSEYDALMLAIKHNKDIRILHYTSEIDSLSLIASRSIQLPSLSFTIVPSLTIIDSNTSSLTKATGRDISLQARLVQPVFGGGTIFAGATQTFKKLDLENRSPYSTGFDIGFEQPLLKNGWKYGQSNYLVQLAHIDNSLSIQSRRKAMIDLISSIRNIYWDYYASYSVVTIFENELVRSQEHYRSEKAKYRIGESSPLDTLSALLKLYTSEENLLGAQMALEEQKGDLALAFNTTADSLPSLANEELILGELPGAEELYHAALENDPEIKRFEILAEKIRLQVGKNRNNLLPELSFSAKYSNNRIGRDFPTADEQRENGVISFLFNYTIPQVTQKIDLAKSLITESTTSLEQTYNNKEMIRNLQILRNNWEQELKRISIATTTKDLAKLQLTATQKAYNLGTKNLLELLDARNELVAKEINLISTKLKMKRLEITLDAITGAFEKKLGVLIQ